jgi:hypothetical protein
MVVYLANAFSLNMLPEDFKGKVFIQRNLLLYQVKALLSEGFENAVGHKGTVELINNLLGLNLSVNRIQVKLDYNDTVVVVQLKTRLEEGQVLSPYQMYQLYEQGMVEFSLVKVVYE